MAHHSVSLTLLALVLASLSGNALASSATSIFQRDESLLGTPNVRSRVDRVQKMPNGTYRVSLRDLHDEIENAGGTLCNGGEGTWVVTDDRDNYFKALLAADRKVKVRAYLKFPMDVSTEWCELVSLTYRP